MRVCITPNDDFALTFCRSFFRVNRYCIYQIPFIVNFSVLHSLDSLLNIARCKRAHICELSLTKYASSHRARELRVSLFVYILYFHIKCGVQGVLNRVIKSYNAVFKSVRSNTLRISVHSAKFILVL